MTLIHIIFRQRLVLVDVDFLYIVEIIIIIMHKFVRRAKSVVTLNRRRRKNLIMSYYVV